MSNSYTVLRRAVALSWVLTAGHAAGQNLLVNPEFTSNISGWTAQSGSGALWAWDNVNGFPAQGSAFGLNSRTFGPAIIVLSQCVPVARSYYSYTLRGVMRVASNQGSTGLAAMQWNFYPTAGCTGTTPYTTQHVGSHADTGGRWRGVSDAGSVAVPVGAVSALIQLVVLKYESTGAFAAEFDHIYFGRVNNVKGDLDGDGQTDLFLLHDSGPWVDAQVWLMNGVTRMGPSWPLELVPTTAAWRLVGTDDWNNDKNQDLLFQEPSTGATQILLMQGNYGWLNPVYLPNTPSPDWNIEATADFDWNGTPDLVWRNATNGQLLVWTMTGVQQSGTIIPNPNSLPDTNWRVVGARDFNGDYSIDLLLYNAVSGKIVFWFLDAGLNRITGQFANPDSAGDANWKVVATGDFGVGPGGVSKSNDIVWRNDSSGKLVVWHMDKAGNRTAGVFTSPDSPQPDPLNWSVAGPR